MPDLDEKQYYQSELEDSPSDFGDANIEQGIEDAEDYANQGDGLGKQAAKKGAEKGAEKAISSSKAATAAKATPWGRALFAFLSFTKGNKKAVLTGGGIAGAIFSIAFFIITVVTPASQVVWMSSVLSDFNFGPHNRTVTERVRNLRNMTSDLRNNETRIGNQANAIASSESGQNRVNRADRRLFIRGNQRFNFRETINNRINTVRARSNLPRRVWSIFEGNPRSAEGYRSPGRRISGTDSMRTSNRNVPSAYQDAVDNVRSSNNPRAARVQAIRSLTRGSTPLIIAAAGCSAAILDSVIPDEEERYEILMSRAADTQTAGSQAATGEDTHGDEVADFMDEFTETRTYVSPEYFDDEEIDEDDLSSFEVEGDDGEVEEMYELEGSAQELGFDESEVDEVGFHFGNSAAWKRNTRQTPEGDEMDINMTFEIEQGAFAQTVLGAGSFINSITADYAGPMCGVLASGTVAWVLGGAEWLATIFTGGLSGILRLGVQEAAAFLIGTAILNAAYDGFVPDTPEELFAHTDMGSNMANSENARNQGAPPMSGDNMNEERLDNFRELAKEDRSRGLVWRYLSPENHRSALTKVAMSNGPFKPSNLIQPFTNFSSTIGGAFSRIFSPIQANNHLNDFNNYDIEQFSYEQSTAEDLDPVENDQYIAYIDGEEFDLEGRGYYCTFEEMPEFEWDAKSEERRQELSEKGNGEQIRANLYIYYNFEGPPDPDDDDEEPTRCNTSRWQDATLMYELINKCMEPPYYEMTDEDNYRRNVLLGNDTVHTEIVEDGNDPWERQFAWNTPFNPRFGGSSFDCLSPESYSFTDSRNRETNAREFWERVGVRRLDQDLMDVMECISHDEPCDNTPGSQANNWMEDGSVFYDQPTLHEDGLADRSYNPDVIEGEQ